MAKPRFHVASVLPAQYRRLLWQTFFEERQRGFSLEHHFPQMGAPGDAMSYCVLADGDEVLGGLTIRLLPMPVDADPPRAAAIGLVCVARAHRGKGLSQLLLQHSIDHLAVRGIEAVTLWTNKAAVYRPLGFAPADSTIQGWVSGLHCALDHQHKELRAVRWPDVLEHQSGRRGLPPFALGAQRLRCAESDTSAVVLCDPLGLAVAEWRGPDHAVADLLARMMPPRWRLHALASDTLPRELETRGATVDLTESLLQMWRAASPPATWTSHYPLRILDRI